MEAVQGGMLLRSGDAAAGAPASGPRPVDPAAAFPENAGKPAVCRGAIEVRVSYAGECSVEEAVSRYLAARENVRDVIGDELG